jgi:hypothetical protein
MRACKSVVLSPLYGNPQRRRREDGFHGLGIVSRTRKEDDRPGQPNSSPGKEETHTTYSVNPDCTGQATFTYPDGMSPGLTYFFVLTNYSQPSLYRSWRFAQIDIVVSTAGFNITAVGTTLQ